MTDLLKDADPNTILNYLRLLDSRLKAVELSFASAGKVDEVFNDFGDIPYYGYDDNGILRIIISPDDLYPIYGVHANILGLSDKGVITFYASADDGKLYGVITMDEIKYLLDALVEQNGAQRIFRVGTALGNSIPEGVIEYGSPGEVYDLGNADFDDGLNDWHELQKGYSELATSLNGTGMKVRCMTRGSDGSIYFGLSSSGAVTSTVWVIPNGTGTPVALGTLSTAFNITSLAFDASGNLYAGISSGATTSSIWIWNGTTWAAFGTLSTSFAVRSVKVNSAGDVFAGTTNGTTSRVWRCPFGSTTWAAFGTLTGLAVYGLLVDGSNIYAIGDGSSTSSAWLYNGSGWVAIGTLDIAKLYRSIALDTNGDLYAIGDNDLVRWDGASWSILSATITGYEVHILDDNLLIARGLGGVGIISFSKLGNGTYRELGIIEDNIYALVFDNDGNFYAGGEVSGNCYSWKYTLVDSWEVLDGYAEITSESNTGAICLAERFNVSAGAYLQVTASSYVNATGVAHAIYEIDFWSAYTGGTLISTKTIFTRKADANTLHASELSKVVQVPSGAFYATVTARVYVESGEATVWFDNFEVQAISDFSRLIMNTNGLFAEKDGVKVDVLGGVGHGHMPYAYPIGFTGGTVATSTLPANGGAIACPVVLNAPMLLQSVSVRNTNTATARTWNWYLFLQDENTGVASENTLRRVAQGVAAETFTPTVASNRNIVADSAPVFLSAGVYWLVIQNQHATNTFAAGIETTSNVGANLSQTKTLTVPVGTTLDFVAATWVKVSSSLFAVLRGRVFGESSQF